MKMEQAKHLVYTADAASAGAVLGSLFGYLPPMAALVAILWYVIQIYESKTVQRWLHRREIKSHGHGHAHPPHVD